VAEHSPVTQMSHLNIAQVQDLLTAACLEPPVLRAGADLSAILAQGQVFLAGFGGNHQLGRKSGADAPFSVAFEEWQGESPVTRVSQVPIGGQHTLFLAL